MPVLANPVVRRLIKETGSTLVRISADAVANYPNGDEAFTSNQPSPYYSAPMIPTKGPVYVQ
jgi:hypothetical protein